MTWPDLYFEKISKVVKKRTDYEGHQASDWKEVVIPISLMGMELITEILESKLFDVSICLPMF